MKAPVRDALIVAGGAGTRLMPLTSSMPKPMLPLCGAPLLVGMVRRLADEGIGRVHLVVGADPAPFRPVVAAGRAHGVVVRLVDEPTPLDTAGGVRAVADDVEGTVLVCNGDVLTGLDLGALIATHQRAAAQVTIALTRVSDTSSFGVCVLEGERIVGFVEKPPPGSLPGHDTVNAGTYVLETAMLRSFPRGRLSFEREIFPTLVEQGAVVAGHVSDAAWADLGTPSRYRDGHRLVLDGEVRWPPLDDVPADRDGVRVAPDARIDPSARLRPPVLIGPGSRVGAEASVGPYVTLGSGAVVGTGVVLADVVVLDGATVGASARATVIGARARIAAGALIGTDTVIGHGARVAAGEVVATGERRPSAEPS